MESTQFHTLPVIDYILNSISLEREVKATEISHLLFASKLPPQLLYKQLEDVFNNASLSNGEFCNIITFLAEMLASVSPNIEGHVKDMFFGISLLLSRPDFAFAHKNLQLVLGIVARLKTNFSIENFMEHLENEYQQVATPHLFIGLVVYCRHLFALICEVDSTSGGVYELEGV